MNTMIKSNVRLNLRGGADKTSVALIDSLLSKFNIEIMQLISYYGLLDKDKETNIAKFYNKFPESYQVTIKLPKGFGHSEAFDLKMKDLTNIFESSYIADGLIPDKSLVELIAKDIEKELEEQDKGRLRLRTALKDFRDSLGIPIS